VRREENREAVAEELRLLYVAVTRARDTLLLVGGFNPEGKAWQERAALPSSVGVALGKSYCDWIGLWLHQRADWTEKQGEVIFSDDEKSARLRWKIYSGGEDVLASAATENVISPKCSPLAESQLAGFEWNYPQQQATTISAKTSASALRRLAADSDEDAAAPWANRRAFHAEISNGGLTATQIGTAHHAFFQHVDLKRTGSEVELRGEAERLRGAGLLTAAEAEALDISAIARFWQSPIGVAIREQQANVRREFAFTAAFSPAEIARVTGSFFTGDANDFVVVQGAVDLAVLLPGEIWIVDFKTDRISETEIGARSQEYKNQLWLYAVALERIYHRPVKRRTLHFLALGQSVEMPHQPI